jgi:hypothetical protein
MGRSIYWPRSHTQALPPLWNVALLPYYNKY